EKYFPYETIKTVRSSNIEDIFYQCDTQNNIELIITFTKHDDTEAVDTLEIGFSLKTSGMNYIIELIGYNEYDFAKFNQFFNNFPEPINASFASPVAAIREYERFVTRPQIIEAIQKRASVEVIRNRLYSLYQNTGKDSSLYDRFIQDLSYILFNNQKNIEFFVKSDIRQDTKAIIDFKIESKDIEKDISLLGSGTLQIILILLNLYAPEQERDLNLILFDEPDSHIHRDIQQRLIEIITKFSNQTQIFLTTHNETLIRQIPLHQLFHLENKPKHNYSSIVHQQEIYLGSRFKGIYPSVTNPIISSLGSSNGLDFINAIEANRIIFVEGQDDAKVINLLLQHRIPKNTNKYVFWVLGGISRIFQDLPAYKKVFQIIKNQQSLWDKSVLIFDRDFLNDEYRQNLIDKMKNNFGLETYIPNPYT
ncbi:ATP-dependent nuclease, partial [Geminocystis sp. CENA526]|uniref:ATP-dependent nuclease n=1 Tax=Geminocystis sp. CENA526 TaxID=1355871 RepID=UPI003D7001E3